MLFVFFQFRHYILFALTIINVLSIIMTRRKQPALVGLQVAYPQSKFFHLDRGDLDQIVETLNWKPRGGLSLYAEPLIRLMRRLEGCGGNLKKMMDGDPELAEAVAKVCVTRWIPSTNRTANLVLQPSWEHILERELTPGQVNKMRPERYAALLFHVGTLNPEWDKLAGPCARCGNYYIKKRASQKVYCSRRCGNASTAVVRTAAKDKAERDEKMVRAKALIREWNSLKGRSGLVWKEWLRKQEPSITDKFVTRRVNTGELPEPKAGRKP